MWNIPWGESWLVLERSVGVVTGKVSVGVFYRETNYQRYAARNKVKEAAPTEVHVEE